MTDERKPKSLEGRWDILYRDYSEVYEEWGQIPSVDAAVGITLAGGDVSKVAAEMERVVRPGGLVLRVNVAPGWYGGELGPVISGKPYHDPLEVPRPLQSGSVKR